MEAFRPTWGWGAIGVGLYAPGYTYDSGGSPRPLPQFLLRPLSLPEPSNEPGRAEVLELALAFSQLNKQSGSSLIVLLLLNVGGRYGIYRDDVSLPFGV